MLCLACSFRYHLVYGLGGGPIFGADEDDEVSVGKTMFAVFYTFFLGATTLSLYIYISLSLHL